MFLCSRCRSLCHFPLLFICSIGRYSRRQPVTHWPHTVTNSHYHLQISIFRIDRIPTCDDLVFSDLRESHLLGHAQCRRKQNEIKLFQISFSLLFFFLSTQDVIAGILLTVFLMIPLIPLADKLDHIILSTKYSPIFVIAISILLIIYYPRSDKWTPTR